jgi:TPR repeat protein
MVTSVYTIALGLARWVGLAIVLVLALTVHALADMESAKAAYERGDHEIALQEFKTLAEHGNAEAQFLLANMYLFGEGGEDVPQDFSEALKWYRSAAEQGYSHAQFALGIRYCYGEGVDQDFVQAHMWFSLAAAQHLTVAQKMMEKVTEKMTPGQISRAQEMASAWKPKK